tara:strand:+ start:928 stop:2007 length:1080 start_codon:yes stop_codon:yes gene_type:complete
MTYNIEYFNFKFNQLIPFDKFVEEVLYKPKIGYYTKKVPFGRMGDFITAPTISNLFSEIISIWVVSSWEKLGKPRYFNFVELGPGDGSFAKVFINTLKKFPNLYNSINIFLYEKSDFLKNIQKEKLKNPKIKWINNFDKINKGPVIFFGNEFFDAIPIKQFTYKKKLLLEKYCFLDPVKGFKEVYQKAKIRDIKEINNFKALKGLKFIEFPKLGILEINKIVKKIKKLSGGVLLIDYGYTKLLNRSTIQMVKQNKKVRIDDFFKNLGKADITSLVNFSLLKEYFLKNEMNVKKIVTQKFFLEKMGIVERAKVLEKKMNLKQKNYMLSTLNRLLNEKLMGDLFKVIFAFKSKNNNFLGFK